MGKATEKKMMVVSTNSKKKKRGRPSLSDIRNRALIQNPQFNRNRNQSNPNSSSQNPNPRSRSTRKVPHLPATFLDGPSSCSDDDVDDDDERREKKVKRLPSRRSNVDDRIADSSSSSSDDDDVDDVDDDDGGGDGDEGINNAVTEDEKGSKGTDTQNGTRILGTGPTGTSTTTPLPDKKLLLLILDRLQKKDTRGVFAEPVDPDDLPDYHEIIENPMDFGTVRSKLDGSRYSVLEQLEADINLICSNAMEYNAPNTIYFRQARSIQELAKKEFETLRQDAGQSEPPPKPRRGRPPGSRNSKKPIESSPADRGVLESSSEVTPASRDDDAARSNSYNLRKGPSLYRFPRYLETCFDFAASSSKSVSTKYGKRQYDSEETSRRDTYFLCGQYDSDEDPSLLTLFGDSDKKLLPVSHDFNHGYARSLAQFAAGLGPVVWRIVSKKIRSVLPPGVEFGPGWVSEENKAPPFSPLSQMPDFVSPDSSRSELHCPSTSGFRNSTLLSNLSPSSTEKLVEPRSCISPTSDWSSLKGINGVNGGFVPGFQIQRGQLIHSGMNGFGGGFGSGIHFQQEAARQTAVKSHPAECSSLEASRSFSPIPNCHPSEYSSTEAFRSFSSPIGSFNGTMKAETEMGAHGMPYWQNTGLQASGSRSSSFPVGSPPQLDLVLQL